MFLSMFAACVFCIIPVLICSSFLVIFVLISEIAGLNKLADPLNPKKEREYISEQVDNASLYATEALNTYNQGWVSFVSKCYCLLFFKLNHDLPFCLCSICLDVKFIGYKIWTGEAGIRYTCDTANMLTFPCQLQCYASSNWRIRTWRWFIIHFWRRVKRDESRI